MGEPTTKQWLKGTGGLQVAALDEDAMLGLGWSILLCCVSLSWAFFFIFLFFIEIHEGFLPCFVFLGAHQVIYKELPAGFG